MKRYGSAFVMLVALCSLAVSGRAMITQGPDIPGLSSTSPEGHQAIRASVLDQNPSNYTFDVRKFSNIGVDENALTFAVYVTNRLPNKCGDFRDKDLKHWKPQKYERTFDLRDHPEVIEALGLYGCVIVRNQQLGTESNQM